jgi:GNAT superfamily N-acetyltransferase
MGHARVPRAAGCFRLGLSEAEVEKSIGAAPDAFLEKATPAQRAGSAAMSDITIRLAAPPDIDALVEMRRDFTFEDPEADEDLSRVGFEADFAAFLEEAISSGRWQIWVAELDGRIVSHIFVALIEKVPRPVRENTRIAYLTNVYTRPEHRGRGIGAQLIKRAQQAARDERVELMIVWPSDESVELYKREGFADPDEPLIWEA